MGTSSSVAELVGKLERFGSAVVDVNPDNVRRVVEVLETGVLHRAAAIAGGDLTFRNNRNRKIGTRKDVISKGVDSATRVSGTGPMSWVEYGVRPHDIVPGAKRGASRGLLGSNLRGAAGPVLPASSLFSKGNWAAATKGSGVVLAFSNGKVSRYARRAGVLKGNRAWSTGVDAAERVQGQVHMQGVLRAGFKAGF
jgi:hypothetical protein